MSDNKELPTIRGQINFVEHILNMMRNAEKPNPTREYAEEIVNHFEGVVEAHLKQYPELSDTLYDKNCREVLNSLKGE